MGDRSRYLTAPEVAARLRCHERTIRRMIGRGDLPAVRVAGKWLVDEATLPAPQPMNSEPFPSSPPPRRRREPTGRFISLADRIDRAGDGQ